MKQLTITVDDVVFEALVRDGPTPEEAARRLVENGTKRSSAWEQLELGLGQQGSGQSLSDTVDRDLYGAP